MVKQKAKTPAVITNRRARHDYEFKQKFLAGIMLEGAEVKSLRSSHGNLRSAFVNVKDGELWLFNATITPTNTNRNALTEDKQVRARKLLVNKRELAELISAKEQGLTIIPTKLLTGRHFIKVEIATGRGLKKYDKREKIKQRDTDRDTRRSLKR
ncbi:MAG TPA: SsrA-binding protein SmpB [Patescibacteria group bacterium]|nr:SsrA-binding protein SmpB [Patescibacteria group bacterium]